MTQKKGPVACVPHKPPLANSVRTSQ